MTLHRCETKAPWCGTLQRPLDPTGAVPGKIEIYFEYFPRRDAQSELPGASKGAGGPLGTLVATEGGPGFPATESRDEYLALFEPLRATRDVVLMDNRGTGRSGAVNCAPLQIDPVLTVEGVARCGRSLGSKAALYSTAYAADDLAAILEALGAGPIDLYGDSYGTFFEQVFAMRHPDKLRSVVLDGAYPVGGSDYAWYPNYAPAMRDKFNLACQRSAACAKKSGTSLDRVAPVLAALRQAPFVAQAYDGNGKLRRFTADATRLAITLFGSAPAYASVHELDAAASAFVAGDHAPLLRLMAETLVGVDSRDETQSPSKFSAGLAAAVMCQDAPQIFNMTLDPWDRTLERDRVISARKLSAPDTYAPFTIDEYRRMPLDYAFIDECVRWPAVSRALVRTGAYPDVPALIVSGDLDNMTPVADGEQVAKRFSHGRQLVVPNGFHVNALPHSRSSCPAQIVRQFIETLEPGDTSCLQSIPEVRLLPRFARRIGELTPARALAGNAANSAYLQVAAAAVFAAGDIVARIESNTTGEGVGLRGGRFQVAASDGHYRLTLREVRWTEDLAVSGTVIWPGRSGDARADLTVAGPDGLNGRLQVSWVEGIAQARAQLRGELGGSAVVAEVPAP